jgi:voltage-gated potassium channel
LNPKLRIVAEGIEKETEPKLRKAGADAVILPNAIGGMRMASEMIRPAVVSFLDLMLREKNRTLRVENVTIRSGSSLVDKSIKELRMGERFDILLLALGKMGSEDFQFNPPQETILKENDILIVMGNISKVSEFRRLCEPGPRTRS